MSLNSNNTNMINRFRESLARAIALKPELTETILEKAEISKYTLDRYLKGASKKMPFTHIVTICLICVIDLNYIATGNKKMNNRIKRMCENLAFGQSYENGYDNIQLIWKDKIPEHLKAQQIQNALGGKHQTFEQLASRIAQEAAKIARLWFVEIEVEYLTIDKKTKVASMDFNTEEKCLINQLQSFCEEQTKELRKEIGPNDTYLGTNWIAAPISQKQIDSDDR